MATQTEQNGKTLGDIARECGVSVMTVSRVLRNRGPVKDSTRSRILEAAERIGYLQGTRSGRPGTPQPASPAVEVVLGRFGRSTPVFYQELLTTIEQELARHHLDCIVRTCNGGYDQFLTLQEAMKRSPASGTMIVGDFLPEHLQAVLRAVPHALLVDHPGDVSLEMDYESISFDNTEAARIAIRHLFSSGRERILLLRGPASHYFSREIEIGYRETLRHCGRNCDEALIAEADFTAEGACTAINDVLARGVSFDAVFTNDEMASGVYRALHQHRIPIPGSVAVCGCDGLPLGRQLFPALTTVVLDYVQIGRMAVDYLLRMKDVPHTSCRTRLVPKLEKREST